MWGVFGCGMWDLDLVHDQGWNLGPLHWKRGVLTTGAPGKSPALVFKSTLCMLSLFSRVLLFVTPWTVAHQAPLSTGFSRQEHWSGLPLPSPKGTIERKKVKSFSRIRLFATLWPVALQAPLPVEFSRQEYSSQ